MKKVAVTIILLIVFSISMGFMESAVVVYLRELLYPGGFKFPLAPIPPLLAYTELSREAATIIMLLIIGILSGRNFTERFSYFLFCFAVWDLFYYVFLYVLLGWPESFLTWDILFLIPVPWAGPVLAPCMVSVTMIALSASVVSLQQRNPAVTLQPAEWTLLIAGSFIIIASFTFDFTEQLLKNFSIENMSIDSHLIYNIIYTYIPKTYNWWLFIAGELLILAGIFSLNYRYRKVANSLP